MTTLLATTSPTLWFTSRAMGTVALVLLTGSVVLGILTTTRASAPGVPRFALSELHRRVALLAVAFLTLHVLTAVFDTFVPIGWPAAFVPFASHYQTLWIGLGTVAFDLILAVSITSIFRRQVGAHLFRFVHWAVYLSWPVAIAHGITAGTDLRFGWMQILVGACIASVLAAVGWRLWANPYRGGHRTAVPRPSRRAAVERSPVRRPVDVAPRSRSSQLANPRSR